MLPVACGHLRPRANRGLPGTCAATGHWRTVRCVSRRAAIPGARADAVSCSGGGHAMNRLAQFPNTFYTINPTYYFVEIRNGCEWFMACHRDNDSLVLGFNESSIDEA